LIRMLVEVVDLQADVEPTSGATVLTASAESVHTTQLQTRTSRAFALAIGRLLA
jgi:hypothetical protein